MATGGFTIRAPGGDYVSARIEGGQVLDRKLKKLAAKFPKDCARALNKTAARIVTRVRRQLAPKVGLSQREIKGRIRLYKAIAPRSLKAAVWVGNKAGIPLIHVKGSKVTTGGLLKVGRRIGVKTFEATMGSGHRGYFVRKPGSRHRVRFDGQRTELPIEEPRIYLGKPARPILDDVTRDQMGTFYPTELKRLVQVTIARTARKGSR